MKLHKPTDADRPVRKPRKKKVPTTAEVLKRAIDGGLNELDGPLFVICAYDAENTPQLDGAGLDFNNTVEFDDEDVLAFTRDELVALLEKAGLWVSPDDLDTTSIDGVRKVYLTEMPDFSMVPADVPKPSFDMIAAVTIGTIDGAADDDLFGYVTAALLYPLVKRDISFEVPHGHLERYVPTGDFQVYIWSSPVARDRERHTEVPERIWGFEPGCRDAAYAPQGSSLGNGEGDPGIPIYDGEYAVAELFPNALYIHHDIVHQGTRDELCLYAEILRRCAPLIEGGAESFEKFRLEQEKIRLEAERLAFPRLVEKSIRYRATRNENAIEAARVAVVKAKQAYFDAERVLFAEQHTALDPEVIKTRFIAEFERLKAGEVACIQGLTFNPNKPNSITLHTEDITVEHPRTGKTHLIGKCDIVFGLENGSVNILNRSVVLREDNHLVHSPHVFDEEGRVCLGNIGSELCAYIAHYEIEAAAVLTVAFLQSVQNSSSYLNRLALFPVVETTTAVAT